MRRRPMAFTTVLLSILLILSSGVVGLANAGTGTPSANAALFAPSAMPAVNASGFIAPIPPRDPNAQPIRTAGELQGMVNGGNYYLTQDIDLSTYNGGVWYPLHVSVTLDGQGHTIRNLRIPASSHQRVAGLFGVVLLQNDFTVKNLGIQLHADGITGNFPLAADAVTEYPVYVGGLVAVADSQGVSYAISFSNCYVSGDVTGAGSGVNQNVRAGGLAGEIVSSAPVSIVNCYTAGRVRSTSDREESSIGGLAGRLASFSEDRILVDHSYSSCDVSAMNGDIVNYGIAIGGLVGNLRKGKITNSHASGDVSAKASNVTIGGLVGTCDDSSVLHSSASGNVSAATSVSVDNGICILDAGGLVGIARSPSPSTVISGCFATGAIAAAATNNSPTAASTCARVGGIIGEMQTSAISDCYATGAASAAVTGVIGGYADAGGLAGSLISSGTANCYATGPVNATKTLGATTEPASAGGVVGGTYRSSTLSSCFFDSQTTGQTQAIGNDGTLATDAAKTTDLMKAQATYTSWDFASVWGISSDRNNGTPYLQWQYIHRVLFDSQGGSQVAEQSANDGAAIAAPADPTRSGYNFAGWYKDVACTTPWNFAADTVAGDMTLYAGWAAQPQPQSPSNYLSGISLSAGSLSPAFSSKNTSYTVNLGESDAAVTITPAKAYDGAAMTIDGKKVAARTVTLANGKTVTVTIKVIWNKKTTAYKLTVKRAKSTANTLAALTATAGTWSQPFDPSVTSYTLTLPENVGKVALSAARASGLSTVSPAKGSYTLKNGQTVKATFKVKAQSGSTRTYTVLITRAKSSNANLASLKVGGGTLTPAFNAGVTSYAVTLPAKTASAVLTAKAADPLSKVTINGAKKAALTVKLANGQSATVTVTVVSQAGNSTSYTVVVSRQ